MTLPEFAKRLHAGFLYAPMLDPGMGTASYVTHKDCKCCPAEFLRYGWESYKGPKEAEAERRKLGLPMFPGFHRDICHTTVMTCTVDPLRDEGLGLVKTLRGDLEDRDERIRHVWSEGAHGLSFAFDLDSSEDAVAHVAKRF